MPSLSNLVEGTAIKFLITNSAGLNFKIANFNLRVEDGAKVPVANIKTLNSILIPKYSTAELDLQLQNVKVAKITAASLSGSLENYSYVVSGRLGGFFPFRYRGKLNQLY